jgi:hypothetical protein
VMPSLLYVWVSSPQCPSGRRLDLGVSLNAIFKKRFAACGGNPTSVL